MGSVCCGKKEKEEHLKTTTTQHAPPINIYKPPKNSYPNNNFIPHTPKIQNNNQLIKPHISNYNGFPNSKLRQQKLITKKDFMNMKKHYFNLMTLMAGNNKKTIGQGGQAKIRKYYSPKFKKMVVEKVIKVNMNLTASAKKQEYLDQINLCKEAILLSKCDYPNIVKIYDFIENPITIVMEYCAKGSLRSILDNKKIFLPPLYKIFLILSICDGLGYIHYKGIVHGDLKCDNILLSDEKKFIIGKAFYPIPKLADFGLSQVCPNKLAAGTPGYIAPEIFEGSGLTFKTDIFALGMVMFEILSGLRPLPSNLDLAMKLLEEGIPPCTKEVLKLAWKERDELFLPGIKNAYYDAFYTLMILCISDDPKKRPDIGSLYTVVYKLYSILLKVTKEKVIDESEALKK